MTTKSSNFALIFILLAAIALRIWLIRTDSVAFSSDEAVVGLMARHITQGKDIPTFYYGQDYMGSLDAILVAAGFELLGESVRSIRYVQLVLFLLIIWTTYLLAFGVTKNRSIALTATLLVAIPPMLGTAYTTLTLGGYNEILLFGNIALLLGWQVTVENSETSWRWFLLGLVLGLGWWTNGAIITPFAVIGLMGLRYFSFKKWPLYLLAGMAFFIGSSAWWLYNLNHEWAALKFLLENEPPSDVEPLSLPAKLFAFFFLGLPVLYGFRFPWEAEYILSILSLAAGIAYLSLITDRIGKFYGKIRYGKTNPLPESAVTPSRWIWFIFLVMGLIFMLSSFQDATGRYLLPIWIPAMIGIAMGIEKIKQQSVGLAAILLALIVTFHLGTTLTTAKSEVGIEPQLASGLQAHPRYDTELLAFLDEHDYQYGYASYWVSYRLMFRSGEKFIFDTSLPYDEHGYRAHNNRYAPYVEQIKNAERVVWITQNFPELDAWIAQLLAKRGITYQTRDFGPFHVYYDFSERVAPADFNLNSTQPLEDLRAGS